MRGLGPLRSRDFALYVGGLGVSAIGDWIEQTTTAWLLYQLTASPLLLGIYGGIRAVVSIALGLLGGAFADRLPRRQVLIVTQSGLALSSLALGVLVATGQVAFWHLYVFATVNGAFAAFDAPARRALIPNLVSRDQIQNAVTLNGGVNRSAKLVGPAVGGVLLATFGPAVSYFVNFASYAALMLALVVMHARTVSASPRASLRQDILAGARYSLAHPVLRRLLWLESIHNLFGSNTALLAIFASDVLHAGPEGFGLLLSAQAAGALLATAGLVTTGDIDRKGRAMGAAGLAYVVVIAMLPLSRDLLVAAVVVAGIGLADALWTTMRNTIFHVNTEETYRGRTQGILLVAGRGASQASQFQTGIAVSIAGPLIAPIVGASAILASLAVAWVRLGPSGPRDATIARSAETAPTEPA